ncbi:MAG: hypothetical protein K5924_05615 [Chloroflexi bacterium]|nr:hypothetical protein [Chloroflexota bacterium]
MSEYLALVAGVTSALVAMIATRLVERVARRRALLDIPNDRSLHTVPTPRLGGIGIVVGSATGWVVSGGFGDAPVVGVMLAAMGLAVVGLVDDLVHVRVITKYAAQLAAAAVGAVLLAPELAFDLFGMRGVISGPTAMVLTTVWLTAMINALNFIDGIDGMAAGIAAVIALTASVLVAPAGDRMLLAVTGACVGFLVWNYHPASIFMGDVGSQFLGYLLGVGLLLVGDGPVEVVPVFLITLPLALDTGLTLVRRLASRKNVLAAHREHIYQRLTVHRFSVRTIAGLYAAATAVGAVLAVTWASHPELRTPITLLAVLLALAFVLVAERAAAAPR